MSVLPIILFLLGVGCLFLGWRWQNPPNEEALTALKGLAYLKKEIIRVQDQVFDLEGKLLESKEKEFHDGIQRENMLKEEASISERNLVELESGQSSSHEMGKLDQHITKEKYGRSSGTESNLRLSPKYQEVLELAADGERIPEIAQRLFLSQDAVNMVLRMQPNGGNNT